MAKNSKPKTLHENQSLRGLLSTLRKNTHHLIELNRQRIQHRKRRKLIGFLLALASLIVALVAFFSRTA